MSSYGSQKVEKSKLIKSPEDRLKYGQTLHNQIPFITSPRGSVMLKSVLYLEQTLIL